MNRKYLQDRLFSSLWVPVSVVLIIVATIIGIGELLLALADLEEKIGEIREPYAVLVALLLALVVLAACSNAYPKSFRTEKLRPGDLKTPGTHLKNSGYSLSKGISGILSLFE